MNIFTKLSIGCVRQYEKQSPVAVAPQVNVEVNVNPNEQPFHRSDTQLIQSQPEGQNNAITRNVTYF